MQNTGFFPICFSTAGLNLEVIFVCQLIWLFTRDGRLVLSLLSILGDKQVLPFLNLGSIRRMTMLSGSLNLLLTGLSESGDSWFSPRIHQMILTRIVQRIMLQVGEIDFERCINLLKTVGVANLRVHPALITLSDTTLNFLKKSTSLDIRWFFLLSQFPKPNALQNLNYSANPDLQFAILCREFRKLFVTNNQLFLEMVECFSYKRRKRIFFQLSRTRCFRIFNTSFRLLERVFRDRLPRRISHFEMCERIIDLFFQFMNDTQPSTWHFLRMAFAEESSENLDTLCPEKNDELTLPFHVPTFSIFPSDDSIQMSQGIGRVNSLPNIQPSLLEISRSMSITYYEQPWKSIWAHGLRYILSLASVIKRGNSFLNFVLHSVVNGERSSFYKYFLDLFLHSDVKDEKGSQSDFVNFWIDFQNMRWKYISLGRTVSFSKVFWKFLEILEDQQFFDGISHLCSKKFSSKTEFESEFFQFSQSMQNSFPEDCFSEFFYPRVFELCKVCKTRICYSRHLKFIGYCEKCVRLHSSSRWDGSWSDDED
jgi:hypothetical protein